MTSPGLRLILDTDSYKISHHKMARPKTEYMQYHFIARGGEFEEVVFFGLQHFLNQLAEAHRITSRDLDRAETIINSHLGPGTFDRAKWERLLHLEGLPIRIYARPEGSVCKPGEPLMLIESTDPDFFWLPGHLETMLERLWYPTVVASQSRFLRKVLRYFSDMSSDGDPLFDFRLHDFGGRSYTSSEAAAIGGAAHLAVGWKGTDTIWALEHVARTYNYEKPVAFSVPALEHSMAGTWGQAREVDMLDHLLRTFPTGLLSVVSDTYNYYSFVEELVCGSFKERISAREGVFVVRPDSGDPEVFLPWTLNALWGAFGGTTNSKGYKVLNPKVRVILGDGIKRATLAPICQVVLDAGFSLDNMVFGCGSGLIQKGLDRDTIKAAYKGNHAIINCEEWPVYKDPVTDPGKKSIRGRIDDDRLVPVFENGKILVEPDWEAVVRRASG